MPVVVIHERCQVSPEAGSQCVLIRLIAFPVVQMINAFAVLLDGPLGRLRADQRVFPLVDVVDGSADANGCHAIVGDQRVTKQELGLVTGPAHLGERVDFFTLACHQERLLLNIALHFKPRFRRGGQGVNPVTRQGRFQFVRRRRAGGRDVEVVKLTFLDLCPHVEHELPGFVADFTQYPERWRCQWCKLDRSVFSLTSNVQLPVCHPVTLRPELGTRPDLQFFLRRFVFFNLDRCVLDVLWHDVTELDG